MTRITIRILLCLILLTATSLDVFAADDKSSASTTALTTTKSNRSKPVDVDKAMAAVLRKAVIAGTLDRALAQFGNLVGVPVVTNWTALEKAGVKRTARVSVRLEKTAANKVLDVILVRVAKKGKPLTWHAYKGVIVVSTQKQTLARKASVRAKRAAAPPSKKVTATRLKNYSFTKEPLANVIDSLRRATGLNFHVNWRSLETAGIEKDTPITLVLKNVSASRALDMITEQLSTDKDKLESIYWLVDRGVLSIASGNALNAKTRVTVHDVADLLLTPPNFKGPRLGRSVRGAGNSSSQDQGIFEVNDSKTTEPDSSAADRREAAKKSLEDIIKDSIGEEMWISGGGKGSIKFFRNQMIISQTLLGYKLMANAGVINVFK